MLRSLALVALLAVSCGAAQKQDQVWLENGTPRPFDVTKRSVQLEELLAGGPPKDGIPAIDDPKFVSAREARRFLGDRDRVLGVFQNGVAKAYPINVLNWHEIVNDDFGGQPVTVTWCPLCISAVVYDPVIDGKPYTFGVSGRLYKSALVMYDRQTGSLWSQIQQEAITGPLTGTRLEMLPAAHTTWEEWRQQYPDTLVLSPETGHHRDYGRNPYAGYWTSDQPPPFRRSGSSARSHGLEPMQRVVGIQLGDVRRAYPFAVLEKSGGILEDVVGGRKVRVHFNQKADAAHVTDERGELVPSLVTFWFAWQDFYPQTQVYGRR